jgi:hypothetical protein
MLSRNKVVGALEREWAAVGQPGQIVGTKGVIDPLRTPKAEWERFVQKQYGLLDQEKCRRRLPTTDDIRAAMEAAANAEEAVEAAAAKQKEQRAAERITEEAAAAEPELESTAPPAPAPVPPALAPPTAITVVFRYGGQALDLSMRPGDSCAALHAAVAGLLTASGMAAASGVYTIRFRPLVGPPRPVLVPADEATTLHAVGLAVEPTTRIMVDSAAAPQLEKSEGAPQSRSGGSGLAAAEGAAELVPGGRLFEAVAGKYGRTELRSGRQYTAPLERGRPFAFADGRLVEWADRSPELGGEAAAAVAPRTAQDVANMLMDSMFGGVKGEASPELAPGGQYYSICARTLDPADTKGTGPLNPRLEYKCPLDLFPGTFIYFTYDPVAGRLKYNSKATQRWDQLLLKEAKTWGRVRLLAPSSLAPGGILYITATDSFVTEARKTLQEVGPTLGTFTFPQFEAIQSEAFTYDAATDRIERSSGFSDFDVSQRVMNRPTGGAWSSPSPSPWGSSPGRTGESKSTGASETRGPEAEQDSSPQSEAEQRELARQQRMARFG